MRGTREVILVGITDVEDIIFEIEKVEVQSGSVIFA